MPTYLVMTVAATLLAPFLAPLCWVVSYRDGSRGALRCAAFILSYLWCETIGIAVSAWLWLRHGLPTRASGARFEEFLDANFALQCGWANALKRSAERLFELRFTVQGAEALDGPPAIMLPRHASIADTIIPMVFYAIPKGIRLRYVLKRELLLDPCLDIVGNRLPNCFVARGGADAQGDIARVTALARNAGPSDGLLIYPEGTRFSTQRQQRILERLSTRLEPGELRRMKSWTELLPPHPGGARALIAAAPNLDLVFCAHTGFEGASHFRTLINGSWIRADIRIRFWRVNHLEIPIGEADQREFLFAQWDRMQDTVLELRAASRGERAGG